MVGRVGSAEKSANLYKICVIAPVVNTQIRNLEEMV